MALLWMKKSVSFSYRELYIQDVIRRNAQQPDPLRANTIKNMPLPTNTAILQAFLGLANYY